LFLAAGWFSSAAASLRFHRNYPPIGISLLLAIPSLTAFEVSNRNSVVGWTHDPELWINTSRFFVAAWVIMEGLRRGCKSLGEWLNAPQSTPQLPSDASTQLNSLDRFRDWVWSDAPETSLESDRFEHAALATRIFHRLTRRSGSPARQSNPKDVSLQLRGPKGSGKSTTLQFVRRLLDDSPSGRRLVWCTASCWDFPTNQDALVYILNQMVTALRDVADTLALTSLPSDYLHSVARANWRLKPLEWIRYEHSPAELITRLNSLLNQIDSRLVVVIEDLDRGHFSEKDTAPLSALMHHLRDADAISLLVAGDVPRTDVTADPKLFDFIEDMPQIT
jgi:hypothetical protein